MGGPEEIGGLWAVVPAGGAGTRLWPLSRAASPKFLHDLSGTGRSLLQSTWDRLEGMTRGRVVIVTGSAHVAAVREQLPSLDAADVLVEPCPRDSMPAIGLAAAVIAGREPDAVIGSFAADHVIGDVGAFHDCVREAVAVARTGYLVTLGVTPTGPATAFGYIRQGPALGTAGAPSARGVLEFVEKPDASTAQRYLDSGEFLWNAGMFVVRARLLMGLLEDYQPELARGLREVAARPERMAQVWPSLTRIAIDNAVAEPAAADGRVAVVPASFGWDDVGDFASLAGLLADSTGHPGLKVLGGADGVVARDSTGLVAAGGQRLVALVGVDDLVVVDTPDALLVMHRDRAQEVRAVVEQLKESGRADLV